MPLPTLLTAVVSILSLASLLAWGKPPVRPQKNNTAVPPSAQQQDNETVSDFLPSTSWMEADLASTLCSGLWTHATYESCFPPNPQHLHKCQFCAQVCKSKGLTKHENSCKKRPQMPAQNEPSPTLSVSQSSPDGANLDQEPELDEELPLTLTECSRLVSAYMEHPEWQDFLDSGRHLTTQTTAVTTGWTGLTLDTVTPAGMETPFPALTPVALESLMQLSPFISTLYHQLQAGKDPLADGDDCKALIKKNNQNRDINELFTGGNHSLVIKWHKGPGYVLKIARSRQDHIRLNREQNLYLWLRHPDNVLLNLSTTPMRAAFSVSGKPVLALRQVEGTARYRLLSMRENHSLDERLDFALSVISHFCHMYRRFLEKDVLLADRHDDNIGFNEIPLQGRENMGLNDAVLRVPVMLDLDPYWFGDQEFRILQLDLPTWAPVVIGLLEEVFSPGYRDNQAGKDRVKVIDQIRRFASPVFSSSSSSALPETKERDTGHALQSCIDHWFQNTSPENSELLTEARSHIEPLLTGLHQWDSTPRTVAEWNKRLIVSIGEILQWLNNWKNETGFWLLKDFTDEGIISPPGAHRCTSLQDRQVHTLLSIIHGRLECQKCSRTFISNTEFRKHWQHHQQNKLQHCEICGGEYISINVHRRVHTRERPYKCKHCGKSFSQKNNLQTHLRTHSGEKPYQCEHCGRCFSQAITLGMHLRTHSGEKPYKCEHCGRCFSLSGALKKHLRTHSGEKPYECELCGKCFSCCGNMKRHLHIHFGNNKPYACEHCGRCFSQTNNLKVHLLTHSGDKPYKCEQCGNAFTTTSNLRSHLRTHTGDKPYKCKRCGKSFPYACNRKRHQRRCMTEQP